MQNDSIISEKRAKFTSIFAPVATVFLSNFCVMAMELAAGRLIARHLGSSLYTWTSVIGVVLAGITIGYYLGGRFADKFNTQKALSALFAVGSIACLITIILSNVIGDWIVLWKLSWPVRVFSHVSLLFLLPSVLLGAISPVVAKMALDKGLPAGRTVGDIYAWGAAGSIAGTFAAGFYLIAAIGPIAIIWLVGACLAIMAVLYRIRFWPYYLWLAAFVFMLIIAAAPAQWCQNAGGTLLLREAIDPSVIYQAESQYCYIAVRTSNIPNKRIFVQDKLFHSAIIMGDINDLQYPYTRIYAGITRLIGKNKNKFRVMVIGGGGYVFPRYVEHNWPGSHIEVAEIDPGVTEAAMAAFGLDRNTSIKSIAMDARNYIDDLLEKSRRAGNDPLQKYDFIYEDAINDYSVPYQLVTKEFNQKIADILADDGAYMVNLIDTYDNGQFLGAIIATLQQTFPYVYVSVDRKTYHATRETFVVTATKQPFDVNSVKREANIEIWHFSDSQVKDIKKKASGIVLTDDFSPVENLLTPVVLQSSNEMLAVRYLRDAEKLEKEQKWKESINAFERAVELNPTMAFKVYNEIGIMQANLGNMQESLNAFQKAVDVYNQSETKESVIASVFLNMGTLLQRMGKTGDANEYLSKAVNEFRLELENKPNDALLWSRMGDALATMGDYKLASVALEKAVMLQPDNLMDRLGLAKMLELQGQLPEAVEVVKKGFDIASATRQQEMTAQFNEYLKFLEQQLAAQQKK
jgi:tetratricopeptide (TPR) repeat protein/MFS family permease